jgi:hypothetical protein
MFRGAQIPDVATGGSAGSGQHIGGTTRLDVDANSPMARSHFRAGIVGGRSVLQMPISQGGRLEISRMVEAVTKNSYGEEHGHQRRAVA